MPLDTLVGADDADEHRSRFVSGTVYDPQGNESTIAVAAMSAAMSAVSVSAGADGPSSSSMETETQEAPTVQAVRST